MGSEFKKIGRTTHAGLRAVAISLSLVFGVMPFAHTATITKIALDGANSALVSAAAGQTITNVVSYDEAGGGLSSVTFDDTIQAGQTYVANSLQVPPGFNITVNGPGALQAVSDVAPSDLLGSSEEVPDPSSQFTIGGSTGGDGYRPIPLGNRVYAVFHHTISDGSFAAADFQCLDASTGGLCDLFPATGIALDSDQSTVAGALSGTANDLATPNSPLTYTDSSDRLFIPVHRSDGTAGVSCMQLGSVACAAPYVSIGAGIAAGPLFESAGRIYMVNAETAQVGVVDPTTMTLISASADPDPALSWVSAGAQYPLGSGQLIGNRLYYAIDYAIVQNDNIFNPSAPGARMIDAGSKVYCYDIVAGTACASWPILTVPGTANSTVLFVGNRATTAVFENHATGGLCIERIQINLGGFAGARFCYDSSGASEAVPANLVSALSGQIAGFSALGLEEHYDAGRNATYFVMYGIGASTGIGCYDWDTSAACTGFSGVQPASDLADYATIEDDVVSGCAWTLGDQAILYSYDMDTGATPCLRVGASVEVAASTGFYCDGLPGHVQGWDEITFDLPNASDWSELAAEVRNADTQALLQTINLLTASGAASISGIDYVANPNLSVAFSGTATSGNPWSGSAPRASVSFIGDPPQFCYDTVLVDDCATTSTFNEAVFNTTPQGGSSTIDTARLDLGITLPLNCGPVDPVDPNDPTDPSDAGNPDPVPTLPAWLLMLLIAMISTFGLWRLKPTA